MDTTQRAHENGVLFWLKGDDEDDDGEQYALQYLLQHMYIWIKSPSLWGDSKQIHVLAQNLVEKNTGFKLKRRSSSCFLLPSNG